MIGPQRSISDLTLVSSAAGVALASDRGTACLIIHERDQGFGAWRLYGPNGLETVKVRSPMSSNHGDIVRAWAIEGHGIMLRAFWDVADSLGNGDLVRVLPAYWQAAEVWAASPVRLSASGKVRVCVRFLQEQLQRGPFALPGQHGE
jgi:LysR family transcriptional activator of dmlA